MLNINQDSPIVGLNIQSDKESYAVGESVRLRINLHNAGTETIKTPSFFILPADDPTKNNIQIKVQDSNGKTLERISHTMTGRALYYPEIELISPNDSYQNSIQIAGTYTQTRGRRNTEVALWSLGENPEVTHANEYPPMTQGMFKVQVIYQVNDEHLIRLDEEERITIWKGKLFSNTIKLSIE
jgi:hypothetical protein